MSPTLSRTHAESDCLSVDRHCTENPRQRRSLRRPAPQPAVHRILAITGLLSWFEVHDTGKPAIASISTQ